MPRRYRRRYKIARPLKVTKYSNETFAGELAIVNDSGVVGSHGRNSVQVVPAVSNILGTRKCKNFTIRLYIGTTLTQAPGDPPPDPVTSDPLIGFALVYVPEGNNPSQLNYGTNNALSIYEPNQNVLLSGIIDNAQVYTFKTRLARNLNAGDQLGLVFYDFTPNAILGATVSSTLTFSANFAISF